MTPTAAPWRFVALPDTEGAERVASRLVGEAERTWSHASGRPWLLLRDASLPHRVCVAGRNRLATIGFSSLDDRVVGALAAARSVAHVDPVIRSLAGGFHTVASVDGDTRVQGSASGVQRVHHTTVDGVPVAADRADVLAELRGAALDLDAVLLHLLDYLPARLADLPLWPEVTHVPAEEYLRLDVDGGLRHVPWWTPPEATLDLAEAAGLLRTALADAVALRCEGESVVRCDLSGGLDSTPLCHLANRTGTPVSAWTAYNDDTGGYEDRRWTELAMPALEGIDHEYVLLDDLPDLFDGLFEGEPEAVDTPTHATLAGDRNRETLDRALGAGARTYLQGFGGDTVLSGSSAWIHQLARTDPRRAFRYATDLRAARRASWSTLLTELADRRDYPRWCADVYASMPVDRPTTGTLDLGWELLSTRPAWLSRDASGRLLDLFRLRAGEMVPLGPDRPTHRDVATVRDEARAARGYVQIGDRVGVRNESPYFDDRVMEVCLSVDRAQRCDPLAYKPLMKAAVRDDLPPAFLARNSKNDGAPQSVRALRRHADAVVDTCLASPLGRAGVFDEARLARALSGVAVDVPANVIPTLSCALFSARHSTALTGV